MRNILEVVDLSVGYLSKKSINIVAEGLNFYVPSSTLVGLIGVNGIGKSTLLKTISGIQNPLNGDVYINQKNIKTLNSLELAKELSVVLTEKIPLSNLSVYELIALGRQPYTNWLDVLNTDDLEKINKAIQLVGVNNLVEKKLYELSDGQKQNVLIARAVAQDTDFVILDEPTTHLDLRYKIKTFEVLKSLVKSTEKAILFSTHDIELSLQYCDKILLMLEGTVIYDSPKNIISNGYLDLIFKEDNLIFDIENFRFKVL